MFYVQTLFMQYWRPYIPQNYQHIQCIRVRRLIGQKPKVLPPTCTYKNAIQRLVDAANKPPCPMYIPLCTRAILSSFDGVMKHSWNFPSELLQSSSSSCRWIRMSWLALTRDRWVFPTSRWGRGILKRVRLLNDRTHCPINTHFPPAPFPSLRCFSLHVVLPMRQLLLSPPISSPSLSIHLCSRFARSMPTSPPPRTFPSSPKF